MKALRECKHPKGRHLEFCGKSHFMSETTAGLLQVFDLELWPLPLNSIVNSEILAQTRHWTSVPNFMKIGLFEKISLQNNQHHKRTKS